MVRPAIEKIARAEFMDRVLHETDAFMAAIDEGTVFVVEAFHPPERVRAFRELTGRIAAASPPSWHPLVDGVPDYHRVVDDHPQAWVRSRMHAFYFHAFNGHPDLFAEFADVFRIKNLLAGEAEDAYLSARPSDGVVARVTSNQYPRGGGYLAEHRDPASPFARLQTIIQASEPGIDYEEGGLYVRGEDGEVLLADPHSRMGDLFVLTPDIRHGVAPIDPDAELDWGAADGRWMILPLLLRSDYDNNPEHKPQQVPELRVVPDDHVASIEHFLGVLAAPPTAVIHVGAHEGQEVAAYLAAGARSIVLVEANPEHVATLRERFAGTPEVRIVGCAAGAEPGTAELRLHTSRSGDTQSASLLDLAELGEVGTVRTRGAVEVAVRTLDEIAAGGACDLLVVDVQGAELLALHGATELLTRVKAVVCEIELRPLYAGAPAEATIVELLGASGLERADTLYYELATAAGERRLAWCDALFVRR